MNPLVLLVEDNELNRDLVEQMLEDDYRVAGRADGGSGLAAVRELEPDVVLLDIALPVMDGREIARAIRADPSIAGIPIVALSSHAMPGDAERAMEAGCDAYLTKPIDESVLLATIARLLADG